MKSITLHAPATDNAGLFCDAGATLAIGKAKDANVIDAERAAELLKRQAAIADEAPRPQPTAAA